MTKLSPCVHQDCENYREYNFFPNNGEIVPIGESKLHICRDCKLYERFNLLRVKGEDQQ